MMKKVSWLIILVLFVLIVFFVLRANLDSSTQGKVESYVRDNGEIRLFFCPQDDCEKEFVSFLRNAKKSIHCALFDIGLESVQQELLAKSQVMEVKIVTDNDYQHKFDYPFVKSDGWGLQHNKFCIVDGSAVSTGSMNPTANGVNLNNNNLLLINSSVLATNYETEFKEMWDGEYKGGNPVLNPLIKLNNSLVQNYFCPEDHCAYHVKEELKKAQSSIDLLTFSFTEEGIADILILKYLDGVEVSGVLEARQVSEHSEFKRLQYQGIEVVKDGNKGNMHHKVFIIDNKTVITGSFNPTNNGDEGNDENVLIIEDGDIAKLFLKEFAKVKGEIQDEKII